MLPAVPYDYYKTGLNRDVRSDAPIPRRDTPDKGLMQHFVGKALLYPGRHPHLFETGFRLKRHLISMPLDRWVTLLFAVLREVTRSENRLLVVRKPPAKEKSSSQVINGIDMVGIECARGSSPNLMCRSRGHIHLRLDRLDSDRPSLQPGWSRNQCCHVFLW
jgi:hypothetical protein